MLGWEGENRLQLVLVCSHLGAHLHLAMAESLPREFPVSLCSSPSTIKILVTPTKAVFHREVGEWVVGGEAYLRLPTTLAGSLRAVPAGLGAGLHPVCWERAGP